MGNDVTGVEPAATVFKLTQLSIYRQRSCCLTPGRLNALSDDNMGGQVSTVDVHVVIVGGGFGGIAAALQLKSRGLAFTLIDMKDSFHHNVAGLRASLQPGNYVLYSITCPLDFFFFVYFFTF